MADAADDLEAVRAIVSALEPFQPDDQRRIIRWSAEKLGLQLASAEGSAERASPRPNTPLGPSVAERFSTGRDIRSFVSEKNPISDNQFAATVAYYHRFEAPETERKDAIVAADLQEACRRVGRNRIRHPAQTLVNAHGVGLLDKAERGAYTINAVGENLVAMTLPSGATRNAQPARPVKRARGRRRGQTTGRKPARKSK